MTPPILIVIPHGETSLPNEMESRITLSPEEIQSWYWDYGSNELFENIEGYVIKAPYSRLLYDLNRKPDNWTHSSNLKRAGVVRTITEWGQEIYSHALTEEEKNERAEEHKKFYAQCAQIIQEKNIQFFIAGHTMEDLPMIESKDAPPRTDIALSTNHFQTCDKFTTNTLATLLRKEGFSVAIDHPFTGGYLLKHFCDSEKLPGIQIEVRRGLFSENAQSIHKAELRNTAEKIQRALSFFWKEFLGKGEG